MLDRIDRLGMVETFKVVCPFPSLLASCAPCSPQLRWNVADEQLGSTGNLYVSFLPHASAAREGANDRRSK
jgi:hypothetical protein